MPDKPRLIDADKLLHWLNGKIEANSEPYNDYRIERAIAYEDLKGEVESCSFDPDPPQQPDIKLWSKVKHKHHPSWGIGIFQEFSKKKDKALILWPDRKGMFGDRVIGYCQVERLQKVEGEEV